MSDIRKYFPDTIKNSDDFEKIADGLNPVIHNIWDNVEEVFNNQFLNTMDNFGLSKWENFLKTGYESGDTYAERRFRIKMLLIGDLPFTMKFLREKLDEALGAENYDLLYNINKFTLFVKVHLNVKEKEKLLAVGQLLERILPANIAPDVDYAYNKHSTLHEFTHEELRHYTHEQLRTEELKHMSTPSIPEPSETTIHFGYYGEVDGETESEPFGWYGTITRGDEGVLNVIYGEVEQL